MGNDLPAHGERKLRTRRARTALLAALLLGACSSTGKVKPEKPAVELDEKARQENRDASSGNAAGSDASKALATTDQDSASKATPLPGAVAAEAGRADRHGVPARDGAQASQPSVASAPLNSDSSEESDEETDVSPPPIAVVFSPGIEADEAVAEHQKRGIPPERPYTGEPKPSEAAVEQAAAADPAALEAAAKQAKKERRRQEELVRMRNNPCERQSSDEVPVIDDTREILEEQTCGAALWLDSLFGDGDVDAAKRVHGFLELNNTYSQFDKFGSNTRLHVEADLPNMKNRLSAFVGRENDDDFVRGRTDTSELRSTFPTIGDQNEWLAGLGYTLPGSRNLLTQFRAGVRGLGPPTGFLQARIRYTAYADDDDIAYLTNTPFLNTRDGLGVTQSFDYSHVLDSRHLLRLYSVGTVSQHTVGLNWRNSLIFYQNLRLQRGLAYEAFVRGETDEPEPLYEYGGRVLFRHPYLKQRLYLEWAGGYSFPRDDPDKARKGSANVGLSVELPFGQVRDGIAVEPPSALPPAPSQSR